MAAESFLFCRVWLSFLLLISWDNPSILAKTSENSFKKQAQMNSSVNEWSLVHKVPLNPKNNNNNKSSEALDKKYEHPPVRKTPALF